MNETPWYAYAAGAWFVLTFVWGFLAEVNWIIERVAALVHWLFHRHDTQEFEPVPWDGPEHVNCRSVVAEVVPALKLPAEGFETTAAAVTDALNSGKLVLAPEYEMKEGKPHLVAVVLCRRRDCEPRQAGERIPIKE